MSEGAQPEGPDGGMTGPIVGTGVSVLMLGASLLPALKDWLQVSALVVSIAAGLTTTYAAWKRARKD